MIECFNNQKIPRPDKLYSFVSIKMLSKQPEMEFDTFKYSTEKGELRPKSRKRGASNVGGKM